MAKLKSYSLNTLTIILGVLYAFPLLYMFLTSFKKEQDVTPPSLFFTPTLENYQQVLGGNFFHHFWNSTYITVLTVVFSLILGVLAAYVIAFGGMSQKKANNIYFWFLSTIILPPVAVLIPVYIIFRTLGIVDTQIGLIILYTGIGIPLVVWMVRSFLKEIPYEIIEAAKIDGCSDISIFLKIVLPLVKLGVISSGLLVFVLTWNEFFFAVALTFMDANTLPVYMATFMTQQGYFWASLSAISTIAILPPLVFGLIMQKYFVKALTGSAVKG
ncbi:carbohydrate ABC transporter permease [Gracilibacillus phocaeensis]|uniref:carbohydrate ABC transporter permease n=1 Tax=Gracilibacillus phocaeensis TaxID=2042304 RepID=UPI00102FA811|nr:carbohydrate ABC transporter permease [Gracilibacillus phocaeensis]